MSFVPGSRRVLAAVFTFLAAGALPAPPSAADPIPAAVYKDPPPDPSHPPAMKAFGLPSHGTRLNAVLYKAAGEGPHPAVLLLHGFPGNEQNLDLAQAMRRDGWDVLTLHYRGSWGSPGAFSFQHVLEDAAAATAWLRAPDGGGAEGVDPTRIVLVGHSMGGWAAFLTLSADLSAEAAALISPGDLSALAPAPRETIAKRLDVELATAEGARPLGGTSSEALADELKAAGSRWSLQAAAPGVRARPVLIVTSDDGLAGSADQLAAALRAASPDAVATRHLATDHSYSGQRLALEAVVLSWLENLPGAPTGL